MKKITLFSIGFIVTCGWLASGVSWAAPPFLVPAKGGLPACKAELAECIINLTETENWLQVCQDELTQCQATESQAFPATGQTSCWSGVIPIDCEGTGQDGDIRAGAPLDYTDTGLTIIDNNTQLEWMKQDDNNLGCGSYPGNLDKDCQFNWDDAFTFVANLNANNHAGYADWRVPNVKELQGIVNYENIRPVPPVSGEFNTGCVRGCTVDACSCTAAYLYWSSTSYANLPMAAWFVPFDNNNVGSIGGPKSQPCAVRAVRGGLID